MISVTKQFGTEGRRPFAVLAFLSGLVLAIVASAALPQLASAGPTEYPVRLCSPVYPGNGNTFNPGIGNPSVYSRDSGGSIQNEMTMHGSNFTVWDPALRCGNRNSGENTSVGSYGMRLLNASSSVWDENDEAGLQWVVPAGLSIRQVGMKGRALHPAGGPNDPQGGIGGGGTFLKFEFVGGESKRWNPSPTYQSMNGFSASEVQNTSTYRLGIICDPVNSGTVCIGGQGENALINDLQFTVTDPIKPSITIGNSPIANSDWVSGSQNVTFTAEDNGSGLRETAVFVDDSLITEKTIGGCSIIDGTFAAGADSIKQATTWKPCTDDPVTDTVAIDTTKFGDGLHNLKVCARDFAGSSRHWNGDVKAAWTCAQDKEIKIDNTAPSAPETADAIDTRIPRAVNPNDVTWTNPGTEDGGSPIHAVAYNVVNQAGKTVVPPQVVTNGADSTVPANKPAADNIIHVPTLNTPQEAGEYSVQMNLIDSVGHVGKVAEVPVSYSCENSGGIPLPQADIAMGLVEPQEPTELAKDFLGLDQGEKSTVVGKVRGPGQMPINGADLCINAKPVVDPQLQLLNEATTNGNGNYTSPLTPGPSRNLLTVFRQGHRETWSDPVRTDVTVAPTLSTGLEGDYGAVKTKVKVRSGQKVWFKGQIPGPYPDKVLVVMQGKAKGVGEDSDPKSWRAFRRYRTRFGGKFTMPNRFYNTSKTRKAHILVRSQVRNQVGYPYSEGDSQVLEVVILPKKSKKINKVKKCRTIKMKNGKKTKKCKWVKKR